MLCENCKEREATVHFTEIMNGRVQKHHLCKECAAQMEMMGYASNEVPFVKLLTGMLAAGPSGPFCSNHLSIMLLLCL